MPLWLQFTWWEPALNKYLPGLRHILSIICRKPAAMVMEMFIALPSVVFPVRLWYIKRK